MMPATPSSVGSSSGIGGPLVPEDIAEAILYACQAPQRVCVREIVICPTRQEP